VANLAAVGRCILHHLPLEISAPPFSLIPLDLLKITPTAAENRNKHDFTRNSIVSS
jgi:hypothetical protein